MSLYPFAVQKPLSVNWGGTVTRPAHGLVLHVAVAPTAGSVFNTFSDPAYQASSHFVVDLDGIIWQMVDTSEKAWAEAGGNAAWISVETVGYPTTPLTPAQVTAVARIFEAAAVEFGFPLQVTDDVNGQGLIDHGDGGANWGGHTGCPGVLRSAQRAEIVATAVAIRGVPKPAGGTSTLNAPVVAVLRTIDGGGYYEVAADGGVFTFGDAAFYGSLGAVHLNQPVVGAALHPTGLGYWLVASDGGVFAIGDAKYFGGEASVVLNKPIVGIIPTVSGNGYWLAAADGGIFSFGDATFHGAI